MLTKSNSGLSALLSLAIRIAIVSGWVAIYLAYRHAENLDTPNWFREPMIQSCAWVGTALIPFWLGMEVALFFIRNVVARIWLLILALASVHSAWFYVLPACHCPIDLADESTWHLLPLFAFMYVFVEVLVSAVLGAIAIGTVLFFINRIRAATTGDSPSCSIANGNVRP